MLVSQPATTAVAGPDELSHLSAFSPHPGFGRQRPFPGGGDPESQL